MTTLTAEAQTLFDSYLQRVRWSVGGMADPAEIERDIREHVDSALEEHEKPVSSQTLRDVLARLGDPWQWIPAEELPLWRRVVMRLSVGPQDWRLAYICFAFTLAGALFIPFGGIVLLIGAFLLARAAYELESDRNGSLGAKRWLIYPPLAFFSLMVVMLFVVVPIAPTLAWGIGEFGFERILVHSGYRIASSFDRGLLTSAAAATWIGTVWLIVAGILALALRPFRWLIVPFGNSLRRKHMLWLAGAGALCLGTGSAILFFLR